MNDLISVIVPVYNVEKYLSKCIESIINQSYQNLEIILIDDGSTDRCAEICDEYAKKDSRIKVIHKQNGGLSSARNYGLDASTGKYIGFIDSDDYIDKEMFEVLLHNLNKETADISICSSYDVFGTDVVHNKKENQYIIMNCYETFKYMFSYQYFGIGVSNKLFKKDILDGIRFEEGRINGEDLKFMYQVIYKTKNNVYESRPLYYYVHREDSITTSKKISFGLIESFEDMLKFTEEKLPEVYNMTLTHYILTCFQIYNKAVVNNNESKEFLLKYEQIIIQNWKNIQYDELKRLKVLQLKIFYYFRPIYKKIIYLIGKMRNI